jgi:hypothetical protein
MRGKYRRDCLHLQKDGVVHDDVGAEPQRQDSSLVADGNRDFALKRDPGVTQLVGQAFAVD